MKKRILKIMLLAVMAFLVTMPLSAFAATYGDLEYEINDDNTTTITGYTTSVTEVTIPSEIDGKKVTSIGNGAFYECSSLTSVTIPDSVTSIGERVFYDCTSLTSIRIPNSVISIGNYAFAYCSSLTSVTIPDSVTSIGNGAFYECSSLTSVTIPDSITSIGNGAFSDCRKIEEVYILDIAAYLNIDFKNSLSNPMYYANKLYLNGKRVVNIVIPDGVTQIPDYAFDGCDSLTGITIPNSVTSIGERAFHDCYGLTSITIPDSVTSVGEEAFAYCSSLTNVTLGKGIETIGNDAFIFCSNMKNVYISDLTAYLNINFINKDSDVDCNETPMNYATNLYLNNKLITNLTIPDGVTRIPIAAFARCTSIKSVTIPDSVTSIDAAAFFYCTNLTSITLPYNLTTIDVLCFRYCTSLKSIVIPKSVTEIETNAFLDCTALKNVAYGGSKSEWEEIYIATGNDALSSATITYNSSLAPTEPEETTVTKTENTNSWTFEVTPDKTYSNCYVYAAIYDSGNNMIGIEKVSLKTSGSTSVTVTKNTKDSYAKVFVWDKNMKPVIEAEKISL